MARFAKRTHITLVVPIRVNLRQVVMGVLRRARLAALAYRPLIKKKPVPLLAAVGLGGAGLSPPCAWITHFIFLSTKIGTRNFVFGFWGADRPRRFDDVRFSVHRKNEVHNFGVLRNAAPEGCEANRSKRCRAPHSGAARLTEFVTEFRAAKNRATPFFAVLRLTRALPRWPGYGRGSSAIAGIG